VAVAAAISKKPRHGIYRADFEPVPHHVTGPARPTVSITAVIPQHCRVCTENSILIDYVTESPNVSGDDRPVLPLPDPVRLAVQVEEPT
jgi:hypothetical protein